MSENNPSLDQVPESVPAEGEQVTVASDEHKAPKIQNTGVVQPKKRGRKPKVVAASEADKSEEEFKPEKECSDGDENKNVLSPKSKRKSNKDDDDDDDDEEYESGDESDDDYDGKKQLKKKVSRNSSAKKPASGAKRGRKPKSQAQKDAEQVEKKAAAANITQVENTEASQNETKDSANDTEGTTSTPSLPNGKRVTRTSSGRLPTHQEVFQPTFKKYKPTKKEEEANNQTGEAQQVTGQTTETSGKPETNGKGDTSINSSGGDDQVNGKRAHSVLEGTAPTNILTSQAELHEENPEKRLKTDNS